MNQRAKPLDREGFLKRVVIRTVEFEDGASVNIRALPAKLLVNAENDKGVFESGNLLLYSLCDEHGTLLFSEGEKDQLMTIDVKTLNTVIGAILEMNSLISVKTGEASAVEKN